MAKKPSKKPSICHRCGLNLSVVQGHSCPIQWDLKTLGFPGGDVQITLPAWRPADAIEELNRALVLNGAVAPDDGWTIEVREAATRTHKAGPPRWFRASARRAVVVDLEPLAEEPTQG